jgi:hypothetical protein
MSGSVRTMAFLIAHGCDVNHKNYWVCLAITGS